jgi:hypothetical protein
MRRLHGGRSTLVRFAVGLLAVTLLASCQLILGPTTGGREPPKPFPIPTTAQVVDGDDVVTGMMRYEEPCLFLETRDQRRVLPIWPAGYNASSGSMSLLLRNGPNDVKVFAAGAETLELHGSIVDVPPPDTIIPVVCAGTPLFQVREAFNRS